MDVGRGLGGQRVDRKWQLVRLRQRRRTKPVFGYRRQIRDGPIDEFAIERCAQGKWNASQDFGLVVALQQFGFIVPLRDFGFSGRSRRRTQLVWRRSGSAQDIGGRSRQDAQLKLPLAQQLVGIARNPRTRSRRTGRWRR
jgi:hypothetical protein